MPQPLVGAGAPGPPTLLYSLGDYSDSLLPPSLAQLELPPLQVAMPGWVTAGAGRGTGPALPAAAASTQLPQLGDMAPYEVEDNMEIGLGSLLGAGADSWLGIAAMEVPHASCAHAARKPFHMLFPTAS